MSRLEKGLVLVTGPTGSGKSTTLAAMVDLINHELKGHIITIEAPIEFVHPTKSSSSTRGRSALTPTASPTPSKALSGRTLMSCL